MTATATGPSRTAPTSLSSAVLLASLFCGVCAGTCPDPPPFGALLRSSHEIQVDAVVNGVKSRVAIRDGSRIEYLSSLLVFEGPARPTPDGVVATTDYIKISNGDSALFTLIGWVDLRYGPNRECTVKLSDSRFFHEILSLIDRRAVGDAAPASSFQSVEITQGVP